MMNSKAKVKICWNCEGRVSLKDENCPYCAVYLHPEDNEDEEEEEISLEPPYKVISGPGPSIPKAPYTSEEVESAEQVNLTISKDHLKQIVTPLASLLFGSVFLLFGFILLLFSENQVLTLRWSSSYWYAYMLLAIPLLFFGWKTLESLDKD
jgi:hypothetical protein